MSDLIERLRYPLEAEVWFRESTDEWVLEISGSINDCCLSSRHTSPKETAPEDVPGQSHLYEQIEAQQAEIARLREALIRLHDCDWVISLPDRMDAVRDIARKALEQKQ